MKLKIMASTLTTVASLAGLGYLMYEVGAVPVICWYWGPYMFVNSWLVLYTWLQHTDPSIPHYGEGEWTWGGIIVVQSLGFQEGLDSLRSLPSIVAWELVEQMMNHMSATNTMMEEVENTIVAVDRG